MSRMETIADLVGLGPATKGRTARSWKEDTPLAEPFAGNGPRSGGVCNAP